MLPPLKRMEVDTDDIAHNKAYQILGKVGNDEHFSNETPFNFIIGLFKIHFDGHVAHLTFLIANSMDEFLDHNSIIHTSPTQNKSRLKRGDKFIKMWSNPGYKDLGDNLVSRI